MVNKGGTPWTRDGFRSLPAGGSPGSWTGVTVKLNDDATEQLRVITDIAHPGDMDYMAFGYWSKQPATSLELDNGFEPFHYGSMPYTGDVKNLSGVATYRGNAIGAYSILDTLTRGHFTAKASLTASFGSDGQIEGRMTEIADIEELFLNSRDPLSGFGDPLPLYAEYDASGRSFSNKSCGTADCDWGGYFLGPSDGGQAPTGAAGWFKKLTIHDDSNSGGRRTARLDGPFGAQQ